jgi:hypothetical protein
VAAKADGTLQEQADIYAQSWEAARDRVKAATEAIYSDLINDDFFITILNGCEKILTFIHNIIDSVGGLGGVIAGISAIVLKLFSGKILAGLENMVFNIRSLIGLNKKNNDLVRQ